MNKKEYDKKYYQDNKERILKRALNYYEKHRKTKVRNNSKHRPGNNIKAKLSLNHKRNITKSMIGKNIGKNSKNQIVIHHKNKMKMTRSEHSSLHFIQGDYKCLEGGKIWRAT